MESKQEEADQDQETPKLDVESTEDKIDTSELIECNGRELGESNQDSLKPRYSNVKFKNYRNQTILEISE